jgi:hypothetical protein
VLADKVYEAFSKLSEAGTQITAFVFDVVRARLPRINLMSLVLLTQYFDTLKELGSGAKSNTILVPHSPGALSDLAGQVRNALLTADRATQGHHDSPDGPAHHDHVRAPAP